MKRHTTKNNLKKKGNLPWGVWLECNQEHKKNKDILPWSDAIKNTKKQGYITME